MFTMRLDYLSAFDVRWPASDGACISLGKKFLTWQKDPSNPAPIDAVIVSHIEVSLSAAQTSVSSASGGETARASKAETFRQAYAEAQPLLDRAITQLKARYVNNPADLENWGLDTAVVKGRVSVRKPDSSGAWVDFLNSYVAKEESLGEARLTDPPFETMQALAKEIEGSVSERDAGRAQREIGVETRSETAGHLLDLLQVAAAVIIVTQHKGKIKKELGLWGFEVVEGTPEQAVPGTPAANGASAGSPPA